MLYIVIFDIIQVLISFFIKHKISYKNVDVKKFSNVAELKAFIKNNNVCGNIDEQKLHSIALYLWDVKSKEKKER